MDSKHFPSHSTTDNLPSSLSTPGERSALTAPPPPSTTVDTSGVTTSSTNTGPVHMSTGIVSTNSGETTCISTSHSEASTQSALSIESSTYERTFNTESLSPVSSSISLTSLPSTSSSLENFSQASSSESTTSIDSLNSLQKNSSLDSVTVIDKWEGPATNNVAAQTIIASSSNKDTFVTATEQTDRASFSSISPKISQVQERVICEEKSSEESPQRGVKRTSEVLEAQTESVPSPQKNKKRCFTCSCKLELAQRTIGRCRCDKIFCSLHRLPELHHCDFNHKEDGRREAREKMVKPTRHLGKSFRRDDML